MFNTQLSNTVYTLIQIKKGNTFDIYLPKLNSFGKILMVSTLTARAQFTTLFNNLRAVKTAQRLPYLHHHDFIYNE